MLQRIDKPADLKYWTGFFLIYSFRIILISITEDYNNLIFLFFSHCFFIFISIGPTGFHNQ